MKTKGRGKGMEEGKGERGKRRNSKMRGVRKTREDEGGKEDDRNEN